MLSFGSVCPAWLGAGEHTEGEMEGMGMENYR